jgi:hypothetical protein
MRQNLWAMYLFRPAFRLDELTNRPYKAEVFVLRAPVSRVALSGQPVTVWHVVQRM